VENQNYSYETPIASDFQGFILIATCHLCIDENFKLCGLLPFLHSVWQTILIFLMFRAMLILPPISVFANQNLRPVGISAF
jgi:hypothetical protein